MAIIVNPSACVGCGCCSDVCRSGALALDDKVVVYEEACVECGLCVDMCPVLALNDKSA